MLPGPRLARPRRILAAVGVVALTLLAVGVVISCAPAEACPLAGAGTGGPLESSEERGSSGIPYSGLSSLEERIAGSDVIALVRLRGVCPGVEFYDFDGPNTYYVSALEYQFEVLEYLKGNGGGEFVAVVYDLDEAYDTRQGADEANDLLRRRDTRWDDRKAIIFLMNRHQMLPKAQQADRYPFGLVFHGWEQYTVASDRDRLWLPAAPNETPADVLGPSSQQPFLLEAPGETASVLARSASGQPEDVATIALSEMKAKIAEVEREIAAGGGSEKYRDCVYQKHQSDREFAYFHERYPDRGLYEEHPGHAIGSGLPAGTRVYTASWASRLLEEHGETDPGNAGEIRMEGGDSERLRTSWLGIVDTGRPLIAGEYGFALNYRPQAVALCHTHPGLGTTRIHVSFEVISPERAVQEAFFDPARSGGAIGAVRGEGIVESPRIVVRGAPTPIHALNWKGGVVTLEGPWPSRSDHRIDVIELDGSVSLTLYVAEAGRPEWNRLTWPVPNQPWHTGDQLMLRVHDS